MSPIFRSAVLEEIPQVASLVFHSFPGAGLALDQWAARLREDVPGGADSIEVAEEAGRLVASCLVLPLEQWIAGERFRTMGLGAVAIGPTHRRRGLAARLVTSGMRRARERGDLATALYPFRTAFYQRLGYGMAGEVHQFHFAPAALADAPERERVRLVETEADHAAVRSVYDAWAPTQTGQVVRGEWSWGRSWEGGRAGVLYRNERGEPEGYLVFAYAATGPAKGRSLQVEEAVCLTGAARRGLFAWLGSLGDQWQQIVYRAHPEEGFADWLRELRHPHVEAPPFFFWFPAAVVQMGPMFRLLDVPAALARRRIEEGPPLTLRLEVQDEQIPENAGPWRIRLEGGRIEVEPVPDGTADASLSLGIESLSRAFIGGASLSKLIEAGRGGIDRAEHLRTLDRLLRVPRPWTYDHF